MSEPFQLQLHYSPNDPRSTTHPSKTLPKWITSYRPKVNFNSSQYHFVSEPDNSKHQSITLTYSQNARPATMYFDIEDSQQIHTQYSTQHRPDLSPLKNFDHLNQLQPQVEILLDKQQTVNDSVWAKKYEPKAFYQLLSEEVHNRNVLTWLKSWDWIVFRKQVPTFTPMVKFQKNQFTTQSSKPFPLANQYDHTKLLLLSGPPGCGKTTLARVVARHCGYEVMEVNASDDRSGKALIEKIEAMGKNNSVMNGKPTMIIVDEVDGALEQDGNGIKEVLAYLQTGGKKSSQKPQSNNSQKQRFAKHSNALKPEHVPKQKHTIIPRPIIFICNDPYVKGLKQLRSKAIVVYFRQVQKDKIVKRLKEITQKEKVYIQNDVLGRIVEIANSDVRGSLGILEYVCQTKQSQGRDAKELIGKLKVSFQKDSATSVNEFVTSLLNEVRPVVLKTTPDLKQFSYTFSKIDNQSLLFETFYHNFSMYKHFMVRRRKVALKLYDYLKWSDILMTQSFKCGGQTDIYLMMVFLYYKTHVINEEWRKVQFPTGFFERISRVKQNKQISEQLVEKWPAFMRSTISLRTVIKDYLWILFYAVQTASDKDSDIIECVGKMITYGIQLGSRNGPNLFKPDFDALLVYGQRRLDSLYTITSRNFIQESYEFAKLKSHLLADMSLAELNKNTEELLSQLNIKNRRRKRNPDSMGKNSIKYKFLEGTGTQIAYDLKFKYFFTHN